jgi:hypothetical protein
MSDIKAEHCHWCGAMEWCTLASNGQIECFPCQRNTLGVVRLYRRYLRSEVLRFLSFFK